MKKSVIIISLILLIILIVCVTGINNNSNIAKQVKKNNLEYEQFLERKINGAEVITLINKAISENEDNNIEKDEKDIYISNNKNSIKIDLVMITNEKTGNTSRYKMETIYKVGIAEFVKNFSTENFKCTRKDYHSETGKIAYIEITQQAEV